MEQRKTPTSNQIAKQQIENIIPSHLTFLDLVSLYHIDTQFPPNVVIEEHLWKALFPLEGDLKGQALFVFRGQNITHNPFQNEWIQDILIESCSVVLGNILTQFSKRYHLYTQFQYPQIIPSRNLIEENIKEHNLKFKSEFIIKIDGEINYLDLLFWEC